MFSAAVLWLALSCTCGLEYGPASLSRPGAVLPVLRFSCQLLPNLSGSEDDRSNPACPPEILWLTDELDRCMIAGEGMNKFGGIDDGGPIG